LKKFSELDERFGKLVCKLVADSQTRVTIDDRNIGTRSQSNTMNTYRPRKSHQNGAGGNRAADSDLRICLFNALYLKDESVVDSVQRILDFLKSGDNNNNKVEEVTEIEVIPRRNAIKSVLTPTWVSSVSMARRVTKAIHLVRSLLLRIENQIAPLPSFVIDDHPKYGNEISTAKLELVAEGNGRSRHASAEIFAFAAREHGDNRNTRVHRFITMNIGNESKFQNTYTMKLHPRFSKARTEFCLWYPKPIGGVDDVDPNQDNETSTHVHNVTSTQENDSTRSRVTSNLADSLHRSLNSENVGGTQLSREDLGDLVTEIFNQMGQNIPHMMRSVVSPTNSVASPIFREGSGNSAHHQSASSSSSTNQVGPDISSGFPYNQNTSIWRNFVENFIGESFATPLTACDRSWEWFQLRIGLITGTSAGNIGLRIPALRCYLRSGTVEQWNSAQIWIHSSN